MLSEVKTRNNAFTLLTYNSTFLGYTRYLSPPKPGIVSNMSPFGRRTVN